MYVVVIQISISSVASHLVSLHPGTRYPPHPPKILSCSLPDKFLILLNLSDLNIFILLPSIESG